MVKVLSLNAAVALILNTAWFDLLALQTTRNKILVINMVNSGVGWHKSSYEQN